MEVTFCIETLNEAIEKYGRPEIFNTDQGSQFTSDAFIDVLKSNDIQISMDGKGRWVDKEGEVGVGWQRQANCLAICPSSIDAI